jgi:hypothetical protein
LVEDFAKHVQYNKIDTMEYIDEIKQMREYQLILPFKKVVNELFFSFCINNGLWNRVKDYITELDIQDEDKALLMLLTKNIFSFKNIKNRYYQGILKWYFDRLDKPIEELLFDDIVISDKKGKEIKIAHKLYSKTPAIFMKLIKSDYLLSESIKPNMSNPLINHISKYIEIGKSIQFNIKGFPMNETLYLLCGMAIIHALDYSKSKHTFKQLINLLRSYIQLNIKSLCLMPNELMPNEESKNENEYYNLITYLKLEKDKYNYRYKCAEKYFNSKIDETQNETISNTKYCFGTNPGDEGKTFILTKYSTAEEYNKVWNELEKMYSENKITDELIIKWFDGQLLTRSTCLIGCLLIVLKEHKTIEFIKNEMPDWKAIGEHTIKGTYLTKNEIDVNIPHPKILNDVLDVLSYYIVSKMK